MRSYADIDIQNYAISTYLSDYIDDRFRHIPNTRLSGWDRMLCATGAAELEVDVLRYIRRPNPQTLGLLEGIESLRDAESRPAVTHIRIELSSSLEITG